MVPPIHSLPPSPPQAPAAQQAVSATGPATRTGLYQLCMQESSTRGRRLIRALIDDARERMIAMGPAQLEAISLLERNESVLLERFPSHLLSEFTQAISSARAPGGPQGPRFGELELMDEEQMQEQVEVARALQAARNAVEFIQPDLDGLTSALQGFRHVQPERNPMRPETYVRALQTTVSEVRVPRAVRMVWLVHMGAALGGHLREAYEDLALTIRAQGVEPATYAVRTPTTPVPTRAAPAAGGAGVARQAGGGATAADNPALTVHHLRRLLAGELDSVSPDDSSLARPSVSASNLPQTFDYTMPASLEALQELKQVDRVVDRLRQRRERQRQGDFADTAQASSFGAEGTAQLRRELRARAQGVGQTVGLEVVSLMIDTITRDMRLLEPVREAIRALEPALLHLAMIDPRFFSDKTHPARRLLDEVAQRGLAFDSTESEAFRRFIEPVMLGAQQLSFGPVDSAAPFEQLLMELDDGWEEEHRRELVRRERAVAALLHAEQRNLLAERVALEVRTNVQSVVGDHPLHVEVKRFLFGPWSQVIAEARLRDTTGVSDPKGVMAFVSELAWSAQPDIAGRNKARLTRAIPALLSRLRVGLQTIDYPVAAVNAFLRELMLLHQQALKAERVATGPKSREQLEAEFARNDPQGPGAEPWLAPREASDSGFMLVEDSIPPTEPMTLPEAPRLSVVEDELASGAWVELRLKDRWVRVQLTWVSPHRTLFMFVAADGNTHSMTRQSLATLRSEGGVRVLSDMALVDSALDAVAAQAMANTLDVAV